MTTEFNESSNVFDNYIYAENVKGELVTFEKGTGDSPIDKKDDKNPFIDLDDWRFVLIIYLNISKYLTRVCTTF